MELAAWYAAIAARAAILAFAPRFCRKLPCFCVWLVAACAKSGILALVGGRPNDSDLYRELYRILDPFVLALLALAVFEIFWIRVSLYRAIRGTGLAMFAFGIAVASIPWWLSSDWLVALPGAWRMAFQAHRPVSIFLAGFCWLWLWLFRSWAVPRGLMADRHHAILATLCVAEALSAVTTAAFGPRWAPVSNTALLAAGTVCSAAWMRLFWRPPAEPVQRQWNLDAVEARFERLTASVAGILR
ncbi:MAG: hypothetical protein U0Q16_33380 [Bryobacteraceae bacterium]